MSRVLVVAGEASGDLHGARLLRHLRRHVPGLDAFGLGGEELRKEGISLVAESREISVVGLLEVLRILRRARQIFREILAEVDARPPDAAILIDFPDFNLRLAKALKARGVPVVYYISPQVWAWRRWRARAIKKRVDKMLVLFPFEVEFYQQYDVPVVNVGHPLVDEVPELSQVWDREGNSGPPWKVALLPGSRRSEVERHLPILLDAARLLASRTPVDFRLIQASTISSEEMAPFLADLGGLSLSVVRDERFQAMADCHLAVCSSGTATLEVGLLTTPLLVFYRVAPWTFRIARRLIRVPHISLVNLVLDKGVVPELVQWEASPEGIAERAQRLLEHPGDVVLMRRELRRLRGALGERGASERAALEVLDLLGRGT